MSRQEKIYSQVMEALFDKNHVPFQTSIAIWDFLLSNGFGSTFSLSELEIKERLESFKRGLFQGIKGDIIICEKTSVFHIACWLGDMQFIDFLLGTGTNVNCLNNQRQNGLHFAMYSFADEEKRFEIIKHLLNCGINYKQENYYGNSSIDIIRDKDFKQRVINYIDLLSLR